LFIAGGAALATMSTRARRWTLVSHVLPGALILALWATPLGWLDDHVSFFAACPAVRRSPNLAGLPWVAHVREVRSLPAYGEHAWREVYRP
jgi:hypothetical protein